MIKIYGSKFSSAFRCYWFLEELGVPYERIEVDLAKGENKTAEYLKLNPNGKVPTMIDGDFVLWESLAINYYLAEKYQALQFVGATLEEHAEVNKWCMWSITNLSQAFHPLLAHVFHNTPDSEEVRAAREVEIPRYLSVLDNHLSNKEYLALGRFSLADIMAMAIVGSASYINFDLSPFPNVVAWTGRLNQREALKKIMA